MKVKRFVDSDVQRAMAKVKAELGDDAVILHVRQVREGGIFGFFGRIKTEVTAATEDKKPLVQPVHVKPSHIEPEYHKEVRELRKALEQVSLQLEDVTTLGKKGGKFSKLQAELVQKELDEKLAKRIVKKLESKIEGASGTERIREQLAEELSHTFRQAAPIVLTGKKPLIVALVGPTGVGKTTTIAKLAANFALVEKQKVALVTADTYRVAAVDQLKTFAEIIRVPVEVAVSSNSIVEAIGKHQDKDIVFIDTAGRSPNNQIHMSELWALLDKARPDRVILTMSATTRSRDMLDIIEKFDVNRIDSIIFTKLDETTTLGGIFNIVSKTKKPLAYLTNGQNVPDDIILANSLYVVEQFLRGGKLDAARPGFQVT